MDLSSFRYQVRYEDGDEEELDWQELMGLEPQLSTIGAGTCHMKRLVPCRVPNAFGWCSLMFSGTPHGLC